MSKISDLQKKVGALRKSSTTKKKTVTKKKASTAKKAPAKKAAKPKAPKKKAIDKDSPLKPLEARQERFCQEYLIDLNGTQAAIRAGYSAKTAAVIASENLTKPNISARIQKLFDERSKRVQVDQDYVIEVIVDTIERCRQTVSPKLSRSGEHELTETPSGEGLAYVFDPGSVLRGTEQLGKHLKMFTDKTEHSGIDGAPIETVTRIELVAADGNDN